VCLQLVFNTASRRSAPRDSARDVTWGEGAWGPIRRLGGQGDLYGGWGDGGTFTAASSTKETGMEVRASRAKSVGESR
jgi:hypothetical protein